MERTTPKLIGRLNELANASQARQERRTSSRERLPGKVKLELRRADGSVYDVSPGNVSETTLAICSLNPLTVGEKVGLRLIDRGDADGFEYGSVVHVRKQDQHFVVGVQLD